MKQTHKVKILLPVTLIVAGLVWLSLLVVPSSSIGSGDRLAPTREQSRQCVRIVEAVETAHYLRIKMDDDMSSKIFDQYVKRLDPRKNLFTQKDIERYAAHRNRFDDDLKRGRLTKAFEIFNLYLDRSIDRSLYIQDLIPVWKDSIDLGTDDVLNDDSDSREWLPDKNSIQAVWRKEFINHIITLKLDNQDDAAITETLEKLYKNRLERLRQTESSDIFQTFMNVVTASFDPHTQYMPPRASEEFDIHMSRSLEGIGAVLQTEYEFTKVVRLIPKGPADKSALLMPGDKIIGVGQGQSGEMVDTIGQRIDHVVDLIRGPKNTYVRLKIIPAKKSATTKTIQILRDKVKLEEQSAKKTVVTLNHKNRDLKIGIIEIPTFYIDFAGYNRGDKNYVSTTRDVRRLLDELKKEKIDGLIIDLRDNGGGALQEASELTGLFLKTGPTVQIKYPYKTMRLYDDDPSISYTGPMIVLINRMSASASEIFAGAIKDYNRGLIVGSRSFGKGTVQELLNLNNGRIKLTRAKFYRVSGESTQHLGIIPDIELPHLYDMEDTGESSLDGALPWDTTVRSLYQGYPDLDVVTAQLATGYEDRSKKDPGINYLENRINLMTRLDDVKQVSLNLERRMKIKENTEKEELRLENEYRAALGKPALESLEDDEMQSGDRNNIKEIMMTQAHRIMADFIMLADNYGYTW